MRVILALACLALAACRGEQAPGNAPPPVPSSAVSTSAPAPLPQGQTNAGSAPPAVRHPLLLAYAVVLDHDDIDWVEQNIALIESRPFDGMVINEYIGRNLFNAAAADHPQALDDTGAWTYAAIYSQLRGLNGLFHKFSANFVKINPSSFYPTMPLLNDDAGWSTVCTSATNYARAAHDVGLKGILFDNENFQHVVIAGASRDFWMLGDQAVMQGGTLTPADGISEARERGRQLMACLGAGYSGITVIVTHGPSVGSSVWGQLTGYYGYNEYLLGAFVAGMVEGTEAPSVMVDCDDEYGPVDNFPRAHDWRKGVSANSITTPGLVPFMDPTLAAVWPEKISVTMNTFDKQRGSMTSNTWTPITDVSAFQARLSSAMASSDTYTLHYAQWQDWWGTTTEAELPPWIAAIESARSR